MKETAITLEMKEDKISKKEENSERKKALNEPRLTPKAAETNNISKIRIGLFSFSDCFGEERFLEEGLFLATVVGVPSGITEGTRSDGEIVVRL